MLDHLTLHALDCERSVAFYERALSPLGYVRKVRHGAVVGFGVDDGTPRADFYVAPAEQDGRRSDATHIAFRAAGRDSVGAFYDAAIAAGGKGNGTPGLRAYHPGYYAAFVLDPDGNNVEAVTDWSHPSDSLARMVPAVAVSDHGHSHGYGGGHVSDAVGVVAGTGTGHCRHNVYVAGPFFNDKQVADMERLEAVLESHGKTLFKPRFVSEIGEVGPRRCFLDDIRGIRDADMVIANLMDEDSGTMFEIGYAYAHGIPVYGYLDGLAPGAHVNLMIAQSVETVFSGPDDLAQWLETGRHHEVGLSQF